MNDDLHDHPLGDLGNLAAQLDAAASTVHAEADVGDVRRRLRRQRRIRSSAMTAVVAVAVVASVAVWRSGDQPVSVATAPSSTTQPHGDRPAAAGGGSDATTRTTAEGLRVSFSTNPGAGVPSTPWWTAPASCRGPEQPVVSVVDPTRGSAAGSPGYFLSGHADESVSVDAALLYVGASVAVEGLPAGVVPITTVEGSTVETTAVGFAIGANGEVDGIASGATDMPEPDAWVLAMSVAGDGVRHVEVTFSNGTVDEADAVDGLVGLAARYPAGRANSDGLLIRRAEITRAHGAPIVLTDLQDGHAGFDASGTRLEETAATTITTEPVSPECTPPPAPLPSPGEQPADATAAGAAVTAAVETFMDGSKPAAAREAAMLDPAHGQRVQVELGAGYAAAMTSARAKVTGLVFVSPTTAIVRYDLDLTPSGSEPLPIPKDMFHDSLAKVVFQDGRWLVTPQSLCRITSVATPDACAGMTSAYPDEVYGPGGSAT